MSHLKKVALALGLWVALAIGFGAVQDTQAHPGHILMPTNGYKFAYSGTGALNLTVGYEFGYFPTGNASDWTNSLVAADNSWDATNSPLNTTLVSANTSNKIRVVFDYYGTDPRTGISTGNSRGRAVHIKWINQTQWVYATPTDFTQAVVIIRTNAYPGNCNSPYSYTCWFQKQYVVAHEIGHAIGLAHVPENGNCGDANWYQSVMDYDCETWLIANGPMNFDVCGLQHIYYDPFRGYPNCGMN